MDPSSCLSPGHINHSQSSIFHSENAVRDLPCTLLSAAFLPVQNCCMSMELLTLGPAIPCIPLHDLGLIPNPPPLYENLPNRAKQPRHDAELYGVFIRWMTDDLCTDAGDICDIAALLHPCSSSSDLIHSTPRATVRCHHRISTSRSHAVTPSQPPTLPDSPNHASSFTEP